MQTAHITGVLFRIQARVNAIWKMVSPRTCSKGALSGEKIAGSFPKSPGGVTACKRFNSCKDRAVRQRPVAWRLQAIYIYIYGFGTSLPLRVPSSARPTAVALKTLAQQGALPTLRQDWIQVLCGEGRWPVDWESS